MTDKVTVTGQTIGTHDGAANKSAVVGSPKASDTWPVRAVVRTLTPAMDNAQLFEGVKAAILRHAVLSDDNADLCALWVLFTHCHAASNVSPILAVMSPIMGCGKSTLLSVLSELVPDAVVTSDITPAGIYDAIEQSPSSTLLIDEIDVSRPDSLDFVRHGHLRRTSTVIRKGKRNSLWAPKAIAGIGTLRPTLQHRSLVVRLTKMKSTDRITRLTTSARVELAELKARIAEWASLAVPALADADPDVPSLGDSRVQDNWRPLLAIADHLGGGLPMSTRELARRHAAKHDQTCARTLLLADFDRCFAEKGRDRVTSEELCQFLHALPERDWDDHEFRGPIRPKGVADLMKAFGVKPGPIRIGSQVKRGYDRFDLAAWLAPSATAATASASSTQTPVTALPEGSTENSPPIAANADAHAAIQEKAS